MEIIDVLREMREKISDPKAWCKVDFALDQYGNAVLCNEKSACTWCIVGAIYAVTGYTDDGVDPTLTTRIENMMNEYASEVYDFHSITDFNDDRDTSHEDVLECLDDMIHQIDMYGLPLQTSDIIDRKINKE